METLIRMANAEQEDVEYRRNNIILYKVPESDSILAEDRKKDDNRFYKQFLFGLNIGIFEEDIRKIVRLGKRNSDSAVPLSSILVQLGSRHMKKLVMESIQN